MRFLFKIVAIVSLSCWMYELYIGAPIEDRIMSAVVYYFNLTLFLFDSYFQELLEK